MCYNQTCVLDRLGVQDGLDGETSSPLGEFSSTSRDSNYDNGVEDQKERRDLKNILEGISGRN